MLEFSNYQSKVYKGNIGNQAKTSLNVELLEYQRVLDKINRFIY